MKLSKIFGLEFIVICCFVLSCNRELPKVADLDTNVGAGATIQVFNATANALRNYVYVDNTPISGIAFSFKSIFPATAYGFQVTAGSHTITIKDTASVTTQVPLTYTQSFDAGKSYTVFTFDSVISIKQSTVVNTITVPTDTSARLRFGNFIYNTTALPNVDVYSFRKGASTPIFINVATATVTDFISYPSGQTDTLYVYATGTTTPLIVKQLVSSLTPTRSYTSVYCGNYAGKTATAKVVQTFATY